MTRPNVVFAFDTIEMAFDYANFDDRSNDAYLDRQTGNALYFSMLGDSDEEPEDFDDTSRYGLSLETVNIRLGTAIDLCFRLHFLDAPHGYGIAPAKFSVGTDSTRDARTIAKLCCGLNALDGDFWYPRSNRMFSVVMPDDYSWACSRTRTYGPPTISSWLDGRTRKRGEL